jgi:hypothetical protein
MPIMQDWSLIIMMPFLPTLPKVSNEWISTAAEA